MSSLAEVESPAITCDLDMSLNCLRSVGSTPPAGFPIVMILEVNVRENDGETAGMWAAEMGHGDDVKYLHQAGADVKVRDIHGETAVRDNSGTGHCRFPTLMPQGNGKSLQLYVKIGGQKLKRSRRKNNVNVENNCYIPSPVSGHGHEDVVRCLHNDYIVQPWPRGCREDGGR